METRERNRSMTTRLSRITAGRKSSRPALGLVITTAFLICLVFYATLIRPSILGEDGPVETTSAALFLFATLLGLRTFFSKRRINRFDFQLILGAALWSLLLFLSEVSFGARIFDIEMPALEGGGQLDGGHDIAIILLRQLMKGDATSMILGLCLLLATVTAGVVLYQARHRIDRFAKDPFHFALLLHVTLVATAVLLDLIPGRRVSALEESVELVSASILVWAILVARRTWPVPG